MVGERPATAAAAAAAVAGDAPGGGPPAQAPSATVSVVAAASRASERRAARETIARTRGVVILSSITGKVGKAGALGASLLSAENAAKPTHRGACPIGSEASRFPFP